MSEPARASTSPSEVGFQPRVVEYFARAPSNYRILLVEDDEMVRELVATVMGEAGFQFEEAADGVAGQEVYLEKGPFDIVLADILMPRLTGVELAFRLKELGFDGPVVFISAYADIAQANEHVRMGHWHLIKKPFVPETILRTLNGLLGL